MITHEIQMNPGDGAVVRLIYDDGLCLDVTMDERGRLRMTSISSGHTAITITPEVSNVIVLSI